MQWWGVEIREDDRSGKIFLGRILLHTINSFVSNNNNVCSLIFCIDLIENGAIASHI